MRTDFASAAREFSNETIDLLNPVAVPKDGLLPVERKMIVVLANDDLRQKSGRGDAALLQARGQWSDHWSFVQSHGWYFCRILPRRRNERPGVCILF